MRLGGLLVVAVAACASGAPGVATRRVVIAPEGDELPDARGCRERCAPHVHPGEDVECERVGLHNKLEDSVGYGEALVCVIRPRGEQTSARP